MAIANKGWKKALADDVHLKNGLNVALGKVTYKAVADDLGYAYVAADKVIAGKARLTGPVSRPLLPFQTVIVSRAKLGRGAVFELT
jgi:hypothetical protein